MQSLKRKIVAAVSLIMFAATPTMASESGLKSIVKDAFYGGLSGGLVGLTVLAFTKQPGRHLDFIGYGAAGGVIVGATYGAVSTSRSLAELKENGELVFAMPTLLPEFRESRGGTTILATARLFSGKF